MDRWPLTAGISDYRLSGFTIPIEAVFLAVFCLALLQ